jgi:transposase
VRSLCTFASILRRTGRSSRTAGTRTPTTGGVEQCVGWLKENRAVGTRFDKLAVNYLATVQLAVIRRYLRELIAQADSADRT